MRRTRARLVALAAVWVLLNGHSAPASYFDVEVSTIPSLPSPYQATTIIVHGESTDSCTPTLAGTDVAGGAITLLLLEPFSACAQVFQSWSVSSPVERLPAGDYEVVVETTFIPPPFPGRRDLLASSNFEVADRVGATMHALVGRRAVCRNRDTGERVVTPIHGDAVNCEAAGLQVAPGDRVSIRLTGVVP